MNRYLSHTLFTMICWSALVVSLVSAETLETPHFLIVYPLQEVSLAGTIVETMEEARDILTQELGVAHENPLKIRIVPHLTTGGKARYLPDRRVIDVLTKEAMISDSGGNEPPLRFIQGVLWHEYIHFLQHQIMKRFIKDRDALWFIEGTAEHLGTQRFIGPYSPQAVWEEGKNILSQGRLPSLEQLNRYHTTDQYALTTYFFSSDAVAFLVEKWGMEVLRQITEGIGQGKDLPQSLSEILGTDLQSFEKQWHDSLEERFKAYIRSS